MDGAIYWGSAGFCLLTLGTQFSRCILTAFFAAEVSMNFCSIPLATTDARSAGVQG